MATRRGFSVVPMPFMGRHGAGPALLAGAPQAATTSIGGLGEPRAQRGGAAARAVGSGPCRGSGSSSLSPMTRSIGDTVSTGFTRDLLVGRRLLARQLVRGRLLRALGGAASKRTTRHVVGELLEAGEDTCGSESSSASSADRLLGSATRLARPRARARRPGSSSATRLLDLGLGSATQARWPRRHGRSASSSGSGSRPRLGDRLGSALGLLRDRLLRDGLAHDLDARALVLDRLAGSRSSGSATGSKQLLGSSARCGSASAPATARRPPAPR